MEGTGFATPTSTMGLGSPSAPAENGEVGSGDTFISEQPKKKKKKMKPLKDYIKSKKK